MREYTTLFFVTFFAILFLEANAQVTIGTAEAPAPGAILHLKNMTNVSGAEATANKGLGMPRVALTSSILLEPCAPSTDENKKLHIGLFVYNTNETPDLNTGLHVWDGLKWVETMAKDAPSGPWYKWGTTDFATENTDNIYISGNMAVGTKTPTGVFHIDAGKDNSSSTPIATEEVNDFIITAEGSVGIGTVNPNPSAMLDISSSNKGFLGPRVALASTTDKATVQNPAAGLIVYNTGAAALKYAGYVYWNGTEWRSFNSGSLAPGTIGAITCNAVGLTPSVYEVGKPYEGVMVVPYTGGNGGVYAGQTIGPINGLTATLSSGNFNAGSGNLAFTITGTPTVTTPTVTEFPINIGGQSCVATVGAGDGIAPGDLVYYKSQTDIPANVGGGAANGTTVTNWLSYYEDDLPVIGGKLRLDGYFTSTVTGSGTVSFNPRLVNVSGENVKFWFSAMTTVDRFNTANIVLKPSNWVNLDNGIYNGYGENNTMTSPSTGNVTGVGSNNTEIVTLDLSLDDKWYRVYYYPIIDNNNQTDYRYMTRKVYLSIQRLY